MDKNEKKGVIHLIEGLGDVPHYDISLAASFKVRCQLVDEFKKLGFTGSSFPESMLLVTENIVNSKVIYHVAHYNVFHNLACNICQGHWSTVSWAVMLAFFFNRGNYCFSPVIGNLTSVYSTLIDDDQEGCNLFC